MLSPHAIYSLALSFMVHVRLQAHMYWVVTVTMPYSEAANGDWWHEFDVHLGRAWSFLLFLPLPGLGSDPHISIEGFKEGGIQLRCHSVVGTPSRRLSGETITDDACPEDWKHYWGCPRPVQSGNICGCPRGGPQQRDLLHPEPPPRPKKEFVIHIAGRWVPAHPHLLSL